MLTQNMRQVTDSVEDTKLRTALSNMRFAACTRADLDYLESRTVGKKPGRPQFTDHGLHNVSIITALNSQKDKINEMGCKMFATETDQVLVDFFSDDSLALRSDPLQGYMRLCTATRVYAVRKALPPKRQQELWEAPPATTSDHIPGKLSLCLGLPIMIRNNDATELCITKGQEGIVVGWNEAVGTHNQRVLDTLFVELVDPPKTIQVPGLSTNVVALAWSTKNIWCALPDDMVVNIVREQVLVLLNFAMTDYASQGKTRAFNIVDLNNCRTHFSYYTALSRSSTSAGTVILQGMC
ncbi:hypothetical protein K438DRAFT_1589001 [Mycena galopus ATCC 62051]|nr:hypothetical protein K438DRAFT_1589001 [Mycena galopus ATCC 62051]